MRIGIYGNSIAHWFRKQPHSFISKLQSHYSAKIINTGCAAGSEERILFELKKTKNISVAIIFHADPMHVFVPSLSRDVSSTDKNDLLKKFTTPNNKDWYEDDILSFNNWLEEEGIETIAADYAELIDALVLNKKYLYHPDLQRNRYYGALIQIDQYLTHNRIPVIHCLEKHGIPTWFNFSSGVVDTELYKIYNNPCYSVKFAESDNCINEAGNEIMFNKLQTMIDQIITSAASSRQEYTNSQIRDGGSNPPAAPI